MIVNMNEISELRVVLWGGGESGKVFINRLDVAWGEKLKVLGVADTYKKSSNVEYLKLEDVDRLYKTGRIDGVIITVSQIFYDEIERMLEKRHIPVIALDSGLPLVSAVDIGKKIYTNDIDINVYEITDIFIKVDAVNMMSWCYVKNGIIKEQFNYEWAADQIKSSMLLNSDRWSVDVDTICVLDRHYSHNYWHFVFEVLEKIIRLERLGYKGKYLIADSTYAREYMKIIKIDVSRIMFVNKENDGMIIHSGKYICIQGYKGKDIYVGKLLGEWSKSITDNINQAEREKYPSKLLVKRNGSRMIKKENEDYIIANGFAPCILEKMNVIEQIKHFYFADVVFSPHGAGTANVVFMRPGTVLIESFNAEYVNPCCLNIINQKKIHYQMVVSNHESDNNNSADYAIEQELLEAVLNDR